MALLAGSEAISTVRHLTTTRRDPRLGRSRSGPAGGSRLRRRGSADPRPCPVTAPARRSSVYALFENARRARLALGPRRLSAWRWAVCSRPSPRSPPAIRTPCRARSSSAEDLADGHRPQSPDLRPVPPPHGGPRPGQPGGGGAADLGGQGPGARRAGGPLGLSARRRGRQGAHGDGARRTCRPARRRCWRRRRRWTSRASSLERHRRVRLLQLLPDRGVQRPRRPGDRRPDDPAATHGHRRAAVLRRRRQQLLHARHRQHGARLRAHPGAIWDWWAPTAGSCRSIRSASIRPRPAEWRGFDSSRLQAEIDAWPRRRSRRATRARRTVETYTIDYAGPEPRGVVLGRAPGGERVVAAVEDAALVRRLIDEEPLGGKVTIGPAAEGRSLVTGFTPA